MIKKITFLLITFVIGCAMTHAQNAKVSDANITGHVIDAENGEHMPGCLVKILSTGLATVTDASGHYVFRDLKPGLYTLDVCGCQRALQQYRNHFYSLLLFHVALYHSPF